MLVLASFARAPCVRRKQVGSRSDLPDPTKQVGDPRSLEVAARQHVLKEHFLVEADFGQHRRRVVEETKQVVPAGEKTVFAEGTFLLF